MTKKRSASEKLLRHEAARMLDLIDAGEDDATLWVEQMRNVIFSIEQCFLEMERSEALIEYPGRSALLAAKIGLFDISTKLASLEFDDLEESGSDYNDFAERVRLELRDRSMLRDLLLAKKSTIL